MDYTNPLSIFNEDQLQLIYDGRIKEVKRELMLQYQLEDAVVINLNGKEYDKNTLLKAFDELDLDLSYHKKIFENKPLLNFLEVDNLSLFAVPENLHSFRFYKDYKIKALVLSKLDNLLLQYCRKPSLKSFKSIENVICYTNSLSKADQLKTYGQAYGFLSRKIERLETTLRSPFKNGSSIVMHPELSKEVNLQFYKIIDLLPKEFTDIKDRYASWCNDIVSRGLLKHLELRKFSRELIYTLLVACRIAETRNKKTSYDFAIATLEQELNKSIYWNSLVILNSVFVITILLLIFLSVFFHSSKKSKYDYNYHVKLNSWDETTKPSISSGGHFHFEGIIQNRKKIEIHFNTKIFPSFQYNNSIDLPDRALVAKEIKEKEISIVFCVQNFEDIKLSIPSKLDSLGQLALNLNPIMDDAKNYKSINTTLKTIDKITALQIKYDTLSDVAVTKNITNINLLDSLKYSAIESGSGPYIINLSGHTRMLDLDTFNLEKTMLSRVLQNIIRISEISFVGDIVFLDSINTSLPIDKNVIDISGSSSVKFHESSESSHAFFTLNCSNYSSLGIIDIENSKLVYYQEIHFSKKNKLSASSKYEYVIKMKFD